MNFPINRQIYVCTYRHLSSFSFSLFEIHFDECSPCFHIPVKWWIIETANVWKWKKHFYKWKGIFFNIQHRNFFFVYFCCAVHPLFATFGTSLKGFCTNSFKTWICRMIIICPFCLVLTFYQYLQIIKYSFTLNDSYGRNEFNLNM